MTVRFVHIFALTMLFAVKILIECIPLYRLLPAKKDNKEFKIFCFTFFYDESQWLYGVLNEKISKTKMSFLSRLCCNVIKQKMSYRSAVSLSTEYPLTKNNEK